MHISWFGESCFKLTYRTPLGEESLYIDVFDSKCTGLKTPRIHEALALLWSQKQPAVRKQYDKRLNCMHLVRPGEYEVHNVFIQGVPLWTQEPNNKQSILFRIDAEDISLAHVVTLGVPLHDHHLEKLEGVDILCIPIGGHGTYSAKQAVDIVGQIEPRIVIPMQYHIKGLSLKRDTLDTFVKEIGLNAADPVTKLRIKKKDLPQEQMIVQPLIIASTSS